MARGKKPINKKPQSKPAKKKELEQDIKSQIEFFNQCLSTTPAIKGCNDILKEAKKLNKVRLKHLANTKVIIDGDGKLYENSQDPYYNHEWYTKTTFVGALIRLGYENDKPTMKLINTILNKLPKDYPINNIQSDCFSPLEMYLESYQEMKIEDNVTNTSKIFDCIQNLIAREKIDIISKGPKYSVVEMIGAYQHTELLEAMINKGYNFDVTYVDQTILGEEKSLTPLMVFTIAQNINGVELLLQSGVDPNKEVENDDYHFNARSYVDTNEDLNDILEKAGCDASGMKVCFANSETGEPDIESILNNVFIGPDIMNKISDMLNELDKLEGFRECYINCVTRNFQPLRKSLSGKKISN